MSLREVLKLEAAGRLVYGSPVAPDQLEEVRMPDGTMKKAIRPAVPSGWDFEQRRFVNHHTDRPVVCAGLLGRMAVLRGLGHPSQHPELTRMQQCHGWVDAVDKSERLIGGQPYMHSTADLDSAVKKKGASLRAWVYDLGDPVAPFERFLLQTHQYRSPDPIEPKGVYEVNGLDWPKVVVAPPYDQYSTLNEWREDVVLRFVR